MELSCNLLWLLIALASFAWWRRVVGIRRGARSRVRKALPLVALVCALAILFPTISVTDNLHPKLFVAEDGASSRRAFAAAIGSSHALLCRAGHVAPPALLPNAVLPFSFASIIQTLRLANFVPTNPSLNRTSPTRAPPSL
jgi:hypothetical protein